MNVGVSTEVINNELGTIIQAATHEKEAKSIRDNLEANFFYLENDGQSVIFINCDVAGFLSSYVAEWRTYIAENTSLQERDVIISGTHSHSGPSVIDTNPMRDIDDPWHQRLKEWLLAGTQAAIAAKEECSIGYAKGAAEIGYNRRCCWADGTHSMFGDTSREDFTGIEGPIDNSQYVMFAKNKEGKIIGLIHNNSCHPVNFYGADFYSADYPGMARQLIRDVLGDIPILYFNGAFGDNSPRNLVAANRGFTSSEQLYRKQSYILAGETIRLIENAIFEDNPPLIHEFEDLQIDVRLAEEKAEDKELLEQAKKNITGINRFDLIFAYGRTRLLELFKDNPMDTVPVHVVRIGNVVIVTNPCELYNQFMIDLRRRSPYEMTMFADITDGYCGYCPTMSAAITGGYSGDAIYWTRLSLDAGYKIVDSAAKLINKVGLTA